MDLIDFQDDAIISRALIDNESGNVTLFSFDKGQGLSEYTALYDALFHVVDGEMTVTISGETFHLQRGDMIIMPSNKPHAVTTLSRFKMLLTMIRS